MKYLDRLNRTADETALENNSLIAEEASISIQQQLFLVKKKTAEAKTQLAKLKASSNLCFESITRMVDSIDVLARRKKQLTALQKELF